MSTIDYNQVPLQPTTLPSVQRYINNNQYRRGDVYGGNQNNYQYRNNNNNFYRRNNTFYNRNVQQGDNRNNNYGNINRPPQSTHGRFNSRSRRPDRSGSRQQQQQRRSGPRQLKLNDFMPPQLRDISTSNTRNLPSDFNLTNSDYTGTTNTRSNTPVNALTQRSKFATQTITTNDTTQPFNVDGNDNSNNFNQEEPSHQRNNQQQQTTTASYRRRQRRIRQQQYRNVRDNYNNQFAELAEANTHTDIESNYGDDTNDVEPLFNNNINANNNKKKNEIKQNQNKKKKQRIYLEPTRILRYMQDNAHNIIGARGNQAYALATTSIYDEWVRDNYDLQVWQNYLKMGTQDKHWAKEVIQCTKKRDDIVNNRFVQKKINRFTTNIARANATISDLQIQLATYWTQATAGTTISTAPSSTTNTNRIRESTERLEKIILKYIQHCTQHVKNVAENKIRLAKAQMEEYKALEAFEQISTPAQWNIHLILKPKMKLYSTKNKNYQIAMKRVEYDLPPKFISATDLTFKLDESILNKEEAQGLYNQMRQITKEYRTQAMSLYLQSITREREILINEIKNIIEGFPKENHEELVDDDSGFIAFKHYNELREKRFDLEAEQSMHFLEEQRVEGGEEELVAPTLTRSLGEDFSLQL
jgi:hypothetical protein